MSSIQNKHASESPHPRRILQEVGKDRPQSADADARKSKHKKRTHRGSLTARPCKVTIPKGQSSSNYHFSGANCESCREYTKAKKNTSFPPETPRIKSNMFAKIPWAHHEDVDITAACPVDQSVSPKKVWLRNHMKIYTIFLVSCPLLGSNISLYSFSQGGIC